MNAQDIATLVTELQTDPLTIGYASWIPNQPGRVVNALNAQNYTMTKTYVATARTLLSNLDPTVAATFLETLDTVSATNPVVKWGMKFVTGDGIDIGHAHTVALIDALVAANALTTQVANQVKALAVQPASRAEKLLRAGVIVTREDMGPILRAMGY